MQQFSNRGSSLLAVGISNVDTTLQVLTGEGDLFPLATGATEFYMITVEDSAGNFEIMMVNNRVGDQLQVTRAQEDTVTALSFTSGARVELRTTAGTFENFIQRDDDVIDGGTF